MEESNKQRRGRAPTLRVRRRGRFAGTVRRHQLAQQRDNLIMRTAVDDLPQRFQSKRQFLTLPPRAQPSDEHLLVRCRVRSLFGRQTARRRSSQP